VDLYSALSLREPLMRWSNL